MRKPRLVLVQTIDSDIRCDGTDEEHVPEFGENLAAALDVFARESPDSDVLVVDQQSRPALAADYFQPGPPSGGDPAADPCGFIDAQGRYIAEKAQALTAIIEAYEAEQERVCAQYERCHDDGNVLRKVDEFADGIMGADGNHLTPAGQAQKAELLWPTVEALLAAKGGRGLSAEKTLTRLGLRVEPSHPLLPRLRSAPLQRPHLAADL